LKTLINVLIIGSILGILYTFAGHDYVKFYFGGKVEILELAASINKLCNTNGSCPEVLADWQAVSRGRVGLRKGSMFYYPATRDGNEKSANSNKYSEFTLVYSFFLPDHWFEAQGGVGKNVTSGWQNRET
jgi:hypothetical protein